MGNYSQITNYGVAHIGDQYFQGTNGRRKFLEWLSPLDSEAKHKDIIEKRLFKTGEWVLQSEDFEWWFPEESTSPKTFWCCGTRGVGKTFLVSTVIDHLNEFRKAHDNIGVAWVYCDYKEKMTQSPTNVIQSLLRQLIQLRDDMSESSKDLYKSYENGHSSPVFDEAMRLFQIEIRRFTRVYVVIDALDEWDEDINKFDDKLIGPLRSCVNLMATMRIDRSKEINNYWVEARELKIEQSPNDVHAYISARFKYGISQWASLNTAIRKDEKLSGRLRESLVRGAQGLLLYAKLHVDNVSRSRNISEIKKAINKPLQSGDEMFKETVEKIKEMKRDDRERVERILSWLSCTFRHMTVNELQVAVTMESEEIFIAESPWQLKRWLEDGSDGLIVIDSCTHKIRLLHDAAYDYFRRHPIIDRSKMHQKIAITCLRYILHNAFISGPCLDDKKLDERLEKYPLLRYAAQYWGDHAREIADLTPMIKELTLKLLGNKKLLASSAQAVVATRQSLGYVRHYTSDMTSIQVAASFGIFSIVECLLDQGMDINEVDNNGKTALHTAVERGHFQVVKLLSRRLIEKGSNLDIADSNGRAAIHFAALNGHQEIACWLVENGADANTRDLRGQTALHLAALSDYEPVPKVLLCNSNVNTGLGNIDDRTALHIAAWRGNRKVAEMLLGNAEVLRNINIKDKDGLTALHCAASQGHHGLVEILIKNGADTNASDNGGWTPLHSACLRRHDIARPQFVDLSPTTRADRSSRITSVSKRIDQIQEIGKTIQEMAAASRISLDWLVRITGESSENTTVLSNDQSSVQKSSGLIFLEDSQSHIPGLLATQDELIALSCDSKCKHVGVVKLLLDCGLDVNRKCKVDLKLPTGKCYQQTGCTPLHLAILSSHEQVARTLLGCSLQTSCHLATGPEFQAVLTPLNLAMVSSNEAMVRLLLEKEVSENQAGLHALCHVYSNLQDYDGETIRFVSHVQGTALHLALMCNGVSMVQLLLERGADPNASLLSTEISVTRTGIAQTRLKSGPLILWNYNSKDAEALLKLLINRGADVNLKLKGSVDYNDSAVPCSLEHERYEMTALSQAAFEGNGSLTRLLIASGAEVNTECQFSIKLAGNGTPMSKIMGKALHFATMSESHVSIRELLENGADTSAKFKADIYGEDKDGYVQLHAIGTALDFAAFKGDEGSVNLLCGSAASIDTLARFDVHTSDSTSSLHIVAQCGPIHLAVLSMAAETVRLLSRNKSLVNQANVVNIKITASGFSTDTKIENATAMHLALYNETDDVMQILLQKENIDERASISIEATLAHVSQFRIDAKFRGPLTPLQYAVILQRVDLIRLLFENGATIDGMLDFDMLCRSEKSKVSYSAHGTATVLHVAALQETNEVMQVLLEYGADVNAMCIGAIYMKEWTESGASTIFAVEQWFTTLHIAALIGNDNLVKLLLEKKADIKAESGNQITPLDLALAVGHDSTVELLQFETNELSFTDEPRQTAPEEGHN